jgi:hypothetical protein
VYTNTYAATHNHRLILLYFDCNIAINKKKEIELKRATRSLLEELNAISNKKNSEAIIESRATHVIDSAINLLSLIKENFPPEQAYELERRFINSIKGNDPNKFIRSIRKLRDNKETVRNLKIIEGDVKDND